MTKYKLTYIYPDSSFGDKDFRLFQVTIDAKDLIEAAEVSQILHPSFRCTTIMECDHKPISLDKLCGENT